MCNATNPHRLSSPHRTGIVAIAIAAVSLISGACSDNAKRLTAAQGLLAEAETAVEAKNYAEAMTLLDSLNTAYREQLEVRRQSERVRAAAIEGVTIDSIETCDYRLATLQLQADSLAALFRHVEGTRGLEGYRVDNTVYAADRLNATCVQPRLSDDGYLYIVANLQGRRIGLNALAVAAGADRAVSGTASAERLVAVEGSELLSLRQEEVTDIAQWLATHSNAKEISIEFIGTKGRHKARLSATTAAAIVRTYAYAQVLQEQRAQTILREKLERTLATARDHLANAPLPGEAQ
ncbi:MAG: hypothetical protein ACI30K_05660 [Muribaculaceae bacterium]